MSIMAEFHVEVAGAHMILAGWTGFKTANEAEAFRAAIARAVVRAAPACICADWRRATFVAQDVAAVLLSMLSGTNPHVVRSAILLAEGDVVFNLQAERLVREAGNPLRRTFRSAFEQLAFLGEVAAPDELAAAKAFLGA
jgi:hypothetical protein